MSVHDHDTPEDTPEDAPEEIFAFDPAASESLPDLSEIFYADDQDPTLLTDAGLVNAFYAKVLERLYIGESMAQLVFDVRRSLSARIPTLVPGQISDDTLSMITHQGGASLIVSAIHVLPAGGQWRGAGRLRKIASRILLGRARAQLDRDANDAEARAITGYARRALHRDPETGSPL